MLVVSVARPYPFTHTLAPRGLLFSYSVFRRIRSSVPVIVRRWRSFAPEWQTAGRPLSTCARSCTWLSSTTGRESSPWVTPTSPTGPDYAIGLALDVLAFFFWLFLSIAQLLLLLIKKSLHLSWSGCGWQYGVKSSKRVKGNVNL